MANPLPEEKALYEKIKKEHITISNDFWDLLYNRIGDDVTAINLLCQNYLAERKPVPQQEAHNILRYTRHIKDVVNKITRVREDDFDFPELLNGVPLHPALIEMFTHYIGNDVYMINLVVGDCLDPVAPQELSLEIIQKILSHTRSIRNFMNRLQAATSQAGAVAEVSEAQPVNIQKELTKEEIFLKVRELFAEEFKIKNKEKITLKARFNEDLNLDSVDAIVGIMALEAGFGFEIPDKDAEGVSTVGKAVDYVYQRLRKGLQK